LPPEALIWLSISSQPGTPFALPPYVRINDDSMEDLMTTKKPLKRASGTDLVKLILEHHKPLKRLIRTMKKAKELSESKAAFEEFAPLLIAHAKPEEETMYVFMKGDEDLRADGFEGDTEHGIADQLVDEIKRCSIKDEYMAKVKVLAELVEHHIKEEEEDMLPEFKKACATEERSSLGEKYAKLHQRLIDNPDMAEPHEKNIHQEIHA
jgi:hemerythrin superfamily protein